MPLVKVYLKSIINYKNTYFRGWKMNSIHPTPIFVTYFVLLRCKMLKFIHLTIETIDCVIICDAPLVQLTLMAYISLLYDLENYVVMWYYSVLYRELVWSTHPITVRQ